VTSGIGFVAFLVVTLALLAGAILAGRRARRRRHLSLVAATFASLGATIYFAERLGEQFDLESAGWLYPFHLAVAKTAVLLYVLPVATGIATLRQARWRRWHARAAWAVVSFTVATAVSGTAMLLAARPLP